MFDEIKNYSEHTTSNNGVDIYLRDYGPSDGKPILLVQGLGGQLTFWPPHLINCLLKNGYRPIVYDNRDIGLSSKFKEEPGTTLNIIKYYLRLPIKSEYKLEDMASDGIQVLNFLNIKKSHVLGISMGGMISQLIASDYSDRVLTYTQIASTILTPTPFNGPTREVRRLLLQRSKNSDASIDERLERSIKIYSVIGYQDYDFNTEEFRKNIIDNIKRGGNDSGFGRQMAAILSSKDRINKVKKIKAPTLIIHGEDDPLINVKNAYISHKLIPNSELLIIPKMRHLIEPPVFLKFRKSLLEHLKKA